MPRLLPADRFDELLTALTDAGFELFGPTVRDQAIVIDAIEGARDLPRGWTEVQQPGAYRLERRNDDAWFGFSNGPQGWKRFFQPPKVALWEARRRSGTLEIQACDPVAAPVALIGVRACDLAAIAIQDRVLLARDPHYRARREAAFLVAVNCSDPGGTCFCVSMETGPRAERGFDLALTEVISRGERQFLIEIGSDAGTRMLADIATEEATEPECRAATAVSQSAASRMGRHLETEGIRDLLLGNLEHARWDEVAERCLACSNCTAVCPTCYCTTVEDIEDLSGERAVHERRWDSCFAADHSYLHGGSVRESTRARYRQWLTHKLASWHDQFGTSGCVGCGRCMTWCPVGIDLTEEVAAIRADGEEVPA